MDLQPCPPSLPLLWERRGLAGVPSRSREFPALHSGCKNCRQIPPLGSAAVAVQSGPTAPADRPIPKRTTSNEAVSGQSRCSQHLMKPRIVGWCNVQQVPLRRRRQTELSRTLQPSQAKLDKYPRSLTPSALRGEIGARLGALRSSLLT